MRTNAFALMLLSSISAGAVLCGCQSGVHRAVYAPAATTAEALAELKPQPRAAAEHPTPGSALVNLDKSESNAAGHPNDVTAQRDAAYCYYKLEAFQQAIPALQKVVQMDPKSLSDRFFLGYAQMAVGDLDAAAATMLTITEQKNLSKADLGEAYFQIGNIDWALGKDAQAVESFSRSLDITPRQGRAELALGVFYVTKDKRDQARTEFAEAARDLPKGRDLAMTYSCLGRLAEEAKEPDAAVAEYRQALTMDSTNGPAKLGLARLGKI